MMSLGSAERRDRGGEPAGLGDLPLHWPHQDLQHGQTGWTPYYHYYISIVEVDMVHFCDLN